MRSGTSSSPLPACPWLSLKKQQVLTSYENKAGGSFLCVVNASKSRRSRVMPFGPIASQRFCPLSCKGMPYFHSNNVKHPCEIYYEVKGDDCAKRRDGDRKCSTSYCDRPSIVLVMGFGATHSCWNPQLDELLRSKLPGGPPRTRVLMMDNRGVGRSGCPESKHAYKTKVMATDIICLLDYLKWDKVHVVGHSMGSMVALKLASLAPHRVSSLVLVSATGGGWQALPRSWPCFKVAVQIMFARTARQRAWLDLQLHFNKRMLNSVDDRYGKTREELLYEDYMEGAEGGGPGQTNHGFWGQLHAVLSHSISKKEIQLIKEADIPVMVIHGRHDILALPKYGEALARRLEAPCIFLEGAHMLCRERGPEVNQLLHQHIFHGRRLKDTQHMFLIEAGPQDKGQTSSSSPAKSESSSADEVTSLRKS